MWCGSGWDIAKSRAPRWPWSGTASRCGCDSPNRPAPSATEGLLAPKSTFCRSNFLCNMWIRGSAEASGLASLTPTELDGARTVEDQLAHVYSKLGLTSHVPLAQQAAPPS